MTDTALVQKKLAFVLRCVRELRTMADPTRIATDLREERFVVHTLQLAIQAALDVAFHLISEENLGEPRSNRDAFAKLAEHGVVASARAAEMARMAGFRNVVVHGYEVVDLRVVKNVVEHHLGDLEAFVVDVDAWLARQ
jgi:uncharacterized protein YutE (UPF0331/DUF86 family)